MFEYRVNENIPVAERKIGLTAYLSYGVAILIILFYSYVFGSPMLSHFFEQMEQTPPKVVKEQAKKLSISDRYYLEVNIKILEEMKEEIFFKNIKKQASYIRRIQL